MSDTTPPATELPFRDLLDVELASDSTLVLAARSQRGAVLLTRCDNPRELLHIARSLIQDATERLQDIIDAESQDLLATTEDALDCLLDPDDLGEEG